MMTDGKFHAFLNYASAVLLGLCAIALIVLACNCFSSKRPQTHRIILTVSPDSVYDDRQFCYYTDSLINVINKHEHVIADRYEAILEDRADTQKYCFEEFIAKTKTHNDKITGFVLAEVLKQVHTSWNAQEISDFVKEEIERIRIVLDK